MSQDIRKWFMKPHDKSNGKGASNSAKPTVPEKPSEVRLELENPMQKSQESSSRRKTSKYFAKDKPDNKNQNVEVPAKRKTQKEPDESIKLPAKKLQKTDNEDDDDFVLPDAKNASADATPKKKLKSGSGRGARRKYVDVDESDKEDDAKDTKSLVKSSGRGSGVKGASVSPAAGRGRGVGKKFVDVDESDNDEDVKDTVSPVKSSGRGRGGRGASAIPAGGRGRGSGRGGFMNFGERKDPPNKGQKEVPEGAPDCLAGLTFVISGTLDSLEREEAEDLIKRYGGRITGSISKKTNYLLCDEDIGGRKSSKAKELGTAFLTEDGLFDMIRSSSHAKAPAQEPKKPVGSNATSPAKKIPQKVEVKKECSAASPLPKDVASKGSNSTSFSARTQNTKSSTLVWPDKYKPKVSNDIIGNQSLVKQLHDWLAHWHEQFLAIGSKKKGKKANDSGVKKAVLLCGTPGIGKTTSAKLVCQMLHFQTIEVNASDSRGKADVKIEKGIGGNNTNSVKELISNESLSVNTDRSKNKKTVLIMDEVDGMSAGDRGGVADLISSIKVSKIPIICICNDRYSQKLKSLVDYCLILSFRKPTKQQMAKRLMQIAKAEGLQVNEIALEELAERVNGDMRMAVNQLQYMGLSMSVINYDDIRQRMLTSAKDEDISPFTAVDKLFNFNAGKLRIDQRLDLSMSDSDLNPLIVQENYINYRPSSVTRDDSGVKRMSLIARASESIADGDIFNVQIRKYRQWQLSQSASLSSCIIPAALLHGQRETFEQGERNFNRFGGWLGKNSTLGKNRRLLEDLHVHLLSSRETISGRQTLRLENFTLLLNRLVEPLRRLPKEEAVREVVEFMTTYSISQDDFNTVVELSKYKGHPNPMEGIASSVKAALTRAYKEDAKSRMVRTADFVLPQGFKKPTKKRIAAILEPLEDETGENNVVAESEDDENSSETEELGGSAVGEKVQQELQSLNTKGIQVQLDLKASGNSSAKKKLAARGRGGASARGSGTSAKRKR